MTEKNSNSRGNRSDRILLDKIRRYPGLSLYELSKKTGWKIGRVDGSVRRLINSKKAFIEAINRDGRQVHLVYPEDRKPQDIIEIPCDSLRIENPIWTENAFIYALDNTTIGISGEKMLDWEEISCFRERTSLIRNGGKTFIKIPEKIFRFYQLNEKHKVTTINGNEILITVSGDIIESKKYPS